MGLTKEQEDEFDWIVGSLMAQGDIGCLTGQIPDTEKKQFIDDWNEGGR